MGCGRPQILISVEMIQIKRKIPWTRACTLSFTVGWWKESVRVIGQVSAWTCRRATALHDLDAEHTVLGRVVTQPNGPPQVMRSMPGTVL